MATISFEEKVNMINYTQYGKISVITLNNAPVNALSAKVRQGLRDSLNNAWADPSVDGIVITSALPLFCAGADISEFSGDSFSAEPYMPALLQELENSPKLVVAAINGATFGGGLEVVLACHYRMALLWAKLGLPEVTLGILPGAGGTQRLPRLAGAKMALELITSGKPVTAKQALDAGFVDAVYEDEEEFLAASIDYTEMLLANKAPLRTCAELSVDMTDLPESFFDDFRQSIARKTRGFFAPERCIQAVEAACTLPLKEGLKKEAELFQECIASSQARAQQHLFFAERQCAVIPDIPKGTPVRDVKSVGVIGAGLMGGGIAMNFINAGIPVKLLDVNQEALDRGLGAIRKNYESSVKRGRFTSEQVEEWMALLKGVLAYENLADADLVIEAVFENMELKQQIFGKLDEVCKPGAILASNTSTLDLDAIAAVTKRPEDVIGLHFFSPANVMRLLEIVRGKKTAGDVVQTTLKVARRIKKIGVVAGVCFGFIGNRMLEPYMREAMRLVLEGATPEQVDGVLTKFGLAMGVFAITDLAGNDVSHMVRESHREDIAHDPSYQILSDKLFELGQYGQKTGQGFYIYEGRNKLANPEVDVLAKRVADELGITRRTISDEEIFERCIYMLINEAADILDEGIALRSSDCDIVWVNGYGFPAYRGGPMQYADEVGLDKVLERIKTYRTELGEYGAMWFKPSLLLERLVAEGKKFADL
jgi:3-hydroxyacyl-CoA dehydrogenase